METNHQAVNEGISPDPIDEAIDPVVTESPEGDTGVEDQGVEVKEDGADETENETENPETALETKKAIPPENMIKMKERLIEKAEKRVRELEAENNRLLASRPAAPPMSPEQYYQSLSERSGGRYTPEEIKDLAPLVNVMMEDKLGERMKPLQSSIAETQYERAKKSLRSATDESGNMLFPDFAELEPEIDKEIEAVKNTQPHLLGNETALKSLVYYVRGKMYPTSQAAAEKRGRENALKNKQIVGVLNVNSGVPVKSKPTVGFTPADKVFAERNEMSLEDARDIRLAREKRQKK